MPSITLLANAVSDDHAYYEVSGSYPLSNALNVSASSGNQYAGFNYTRGSNAISYVYYLFDVSEIPDNVKITSVTANIKIYGSTTSQSRSSTREVQLFSGTNAKGSATDFTMNGSAAISEIDGGSSWERSDLDDLRLRVYIVRNTSNTSSNTYCYLMGMDVTIEYEESANTDPGGSDDDNYDSGKVYTYSYTGSSQRVTLPAGKYKLECWGAQGGNYSTYVGGYGGYSTGVITLTQSTTMYIYVGGQPETSSSSRAVVSGGFNGGGNGQNRYYSSTYTYGQGGGGASDIRIAQDSLYARVIVAGGGGGSASNSSDTGTTKYGGGTVAGPGGASESATYNAGQTAPTTSGYYKAGTFGEGADAYTSRTNYQHGSGAGGGGWYGGYAYNYSQDSRSALQTYNGGGSGYVYTSSTASNYPSGCLLSDVYYLTDAETIGGNKSFPSTSNGTERGHQGNGYVRITELIEQTDGSKLFVKSNNEWKQVTAIYQKQNGSWVEITDIASIFKGIEYGGDSGFFRDT